MKSKFILAIITFALFCSTAASGQEKEYKYERDWFGVAGFGSNIGRDIGAGSGSDRKLSGIGHGFAVDVTVGRRFSDAFGLRIGYQGLDISGQKSRHGAVHYNYGHLDAILMGNRYIMPYLHAGYLKSGEVLRTTPNRMSGGIGLMAPIHLSQTVSIVPDLRIAFFDSEVFHTSRYTPVNKLAYNLSFTLGIGLNLARQRQKNGIEYVDRNIYRTDTVTVFRVDTVTVAVPADTVYIEISKEFTDMMSLVTLFDFDRFTLRSEAFPVLDKIAAWMKENPGRSMLIEGYTDQRGSDAYNLVLSKNRAEAVRNYLIRAGISSLRLEAIGHGKGQFNLGNTTEEIHQQNRRVVITVR